MPRWTQNGLWAHASIASVLQTLGCGLFCPDFHCLHAMLMCVSSQLLTSRTDMNWMLTVHWLQAKTPSPAKPAGKPKPKASATRGASPSTTKKGAKTSLKPAAAAAASADAMKLGADATAPVDDIEEEVGFAAAYSLGNLSEGLHSAADHCLLTAYTNVVL